MQWLEQALARGKGFINAISSGIQHYAPRQIHMRRFDQMAARGDYKNLMPMWGHPRPTADQITTQSQRIQLLPRYVAQYSMPQNPYDVPPARSLDLPTEDLAHAMRLSQELYPLAWAQLPNPIISMPAVRPTIEMPPVTVTQTIKLNSDQYVADAYADYYPNAAFKDSRAYFFPDNRNTSMSDVQVIRLANALEGLQQRVTQAKDELVLNTPSLAQQMYDNMDPEVSKNYIQAAGGQFRARRKPGPRKKPGPKPKKK